jgi:hypothetical protein
LTQKITLKISAATAPYIRSDAAKADKMKAARGEVFLSVNDLVVLLFYLCHDRDKEIKVAALQSVRDLAEPQLMAVIELADANPWVLDMIARLHFSKQTVAGLIAAHPNCNDGTRRFLAEKGIAAPIDGEDDASGDDFGREVAEEGKQGSILTDDEEFCEDEDEFRSKYQLSQQMGVGDKIKMALTGDKEWRNILLKDANKLVSGAVVKNPRITEGEILTIAKSNVQNDEIMRVICANKEWVKIYMIRKALVENHRTPLPVALRFMASLTEKDLAFLAKSKNVSTVIAGQARRALISKNKRK